MSWQDVHNELITLEKSANAILGMAFPKNGEIQFKVRRTEDKPRLIITVWVYPKGLRRKVIYDNNMERAANISQEELREIGDAITDIATLPTVHRCTKRWFIQGVLKYFVTIDYSKYLQPKGA